jgi:hypothetical protein
MIMTYSITQEHIGIIGGVLHKELMPLGLQTAILIDQADTELSGDIQGWHL